jgi:predicted permease
MLSHASWVKHFGADPHVIGSVARLDTTRTIVGVMPAGFDFPRGTSYWFPVLPLLSSQSRPDFDAEEAIGVLFAIGRLQPGVTTAQVADELDRLQRATPGQTMPRRFGRAVVVTPFLEYLFGPIRQGLWALWAAVTLLLLIACANVSGLMLTRASLRAREHAIRAALGAGRMAIGRLWVIESTILAIAGGVVGLALARWMMTAVVALAPGDVPRLADVAIDPLVALFTAGAVLVATCLCSAGPARHASSARIADALNDAAYSTPGARSIAARASLVVAQIAVSVVLLVGSGLVVRSFITMRQLDLGFVATNVVTMFIGPQSNAWMRELLQAVERLPQVEAAGAVYLRPLELGPIGQETSARLWGQAEASAVANPTLNFQVATPGFFTAVRTRLVHGRFFSDWDRENSAPVAIVGESAARRLWPGQNPIGQRLLLRDQAVWRTVVGVVSDVHYRGVGDPRLDVYEPAMQSTATTNYVVIRVRRDPVAVIAAVRDEARRRDPAVVVDSITMLDTVVSRALAPWRFTAWLLGFMATVAFLQTAIGLFSLITLDAANRKQELAIRLAFGARTVDVVRVVLVPFAWRAAAGLVIGALIAVTASGLVRSLLFRVQPMDATTWLSILALIVGVIGVAAYLPARRAATIDPMILLRR